MATNIFKVSCFLIDKTGVLSNEDIERALQKILCLPRHISVESAEVPPSDFVVSEDSNCPYSEFQKYFE